MSKSKTKKTLAIGLIAATTFAAVPQTSQANELMGTLLGGAGGAAVGAQFGKGNGKLVGVAIGTLIGAAAGGEVGRSMERGDAAYYGQNQGYYSNATYYEPVYQPVPSYGHPRKHWKHKNKYRQNVTYVNNTIVQPAPAYGNIYSNNSGWSQDYCREYNNTVSVGGQLQRGYGRACLQPDGSWQIVE